MKVVKVKKEKIKPRAKILILSKKDRVGGEYKYRKVDSNSKLYFYRCGYPYSLNDEVFCYDDKEIWRIYKIIESKKPEGNWVNGENLDKIKFPVPCRYNGKYLGLIYIARDNSYGLINIDKQREKWSVEDSGWEHLGNMINSYNIHILKGKMIIYEEEK